MNSLIRRGMFYDPFPAFETLGARLHGESLLWPMDALLRQDQILDEEERTVIRMDIPGVRPEDLQVELKDNTLKVSGTRNDRQEGRYAAFQQIERRWTLPHGIEQDDIQANIENGVLEIAIAKKVSEAVQIPIGQTLELDAAQEEKKPTKAKK